MSVLTFSFMLHSLTRSSGSERIQISSLTFCKEDSSGKSSFTSWFSSKYVMSRTAYENKKTHNVKMLRAKNQMVVCSNKLVIVYKKNPHNFKVQKLQVKSTVKWIAVNVNSKPFLSLQYQHNYYQL